MKLELKKISEIKNIKQLKKFKIKEPIFLKNYLFHYLILTNNLRALKLTSYPVYRLNDDGLNGFHLAAQLNNYKILYYLIKKYPDYVYNRNMDKENFMHYLLPTNMKEYIKLLTKVKLDWNYIFNTHNIEGIVPIQNVFLNNSKEFILKVLNMVNIKYHNYTDEPIYYILLSNEQLSDMDIYSILTFIYKTDNNIFKYTDKNGYNILYPIVINDRYELLESIYNNYKNKVIFDLYSPILTDHIFSIAYEKGQIDDDYKMANFIIKNIISNHDFNEIDMKGNNLAHYILNSHLKYGKGNMAIEKMILSRYDLWTKENIDKKTPLDYITELDYEKYSQFLKGQTINNKYNIDKIKNNSWKKLLEKLKKCETKDDINMDKFKYSHSNMFQARFTDVGIFMKYLGNKYKNLYIPKYNKPLDLIIYNNTMTYPDDILKNYHNFAWIIVWNDINNYSIHPYLNKLIKDNMDKYDYAICCLSLKLPSGGLHASMIVYDFKRKIIERFEPYGNTEYMDMDIDTILSKELTVDNLKYYPPGKYFPVAGFQTLSDENNMLNLKLGDFGGYCLAWSLWYVEHRLKNTEIDPKILIRKTINRFNGMNIKPNEYIRNYANYINKYRVKWLKKILPENLISNENLPINYVKKIHMRLIKENES